MLNELLLCSLQVTVIFLSGLSLASFFGRESILDISLGIISIIALIHVIPVIFFLLFGDTFHTSLTIFIIILSIFSILNNKKYIKTFILNINYYPYITISTFIIFICRFITLPDNPNLLRGDIITHVPSIVLFGEGFLGYPSTSYPRGFHSFFLVLSFGQDETLVARSLFLTLNVFGWAFFGSLISYFLSDIKSGILLLLSSGMGFMGNVGGLLTHSGWWLVRQSNIQPEISAWLFITILLWIMVHRPTNYHNDKLTWFTLFSLLLAISSSNPFFVMTCAPFILSLYPITRKYANLELKPSTNYQRILLSIPIIALIISSGYSSIVSNKFEGSEIDLHDSSSRSDDLEAEFGIYYTEGISLSTISVLITPKIDKAESTLSFTGPKVLTLLSMILGMMYLKLYRGEKDEKMLLFLLPLFTLNLMWLFAIPAPDGTSVVRTVYPYYAFGTLLFIPILNLLNEKRDSLLIFCFFFLCIDPYHHLNNIFLYEPGLRAIIMISLFYLFTYLLLYLNFDIYSKKYSHLLPFPLLGGFGLGYWFLMNYYNILDPDIGIILLGSVLLVVIGLILSIKEYIKYLFWISYGFISGVVIAQIIEFNDENFYRYMIYSIAIFSSYIVYIFHKNNVSKITIRWELFLYLLLLLSSAMHIISPNYVTSLMGSNVHDPLYNITDWRN